MYEKRNILHLIEEARAMADIAIKQPAEFLQRYCDLRHYATNWTLNADLDEYTVNSLQLQVRLLISIESTLAEIIGSADNQRLDIVNVYGDLKDLRYDFIKKVDALKNSLKLINSETVEATTVLRVAEQDYAEELNEDSAAIVSACKSMLKSLTDDINKVVDIRVASYASNDEVKKISNNSVIILKEIEHMLEGHDRDNDKLHELRKTVTRASYLAICLSRDCDIKEAKNLKTQDLYESRYFNHLQHAFTRMLDIIREDPF